MTSIDEAGWQGVLGFRGTVSTAQRYVVLLEEPSLAERVRAEGGQASDKKMRAWTAAAVGVQEQFLARMAAAGVRIGAEHRYVRVLNGFSARLDPTSLSLLERDREVAGVYPVRVAYPAQSDDAPDVTPAAVADLEVPGLDGSGVTVALIDTGVDSSHPYLRRSMLPGIDLINPGSGAIAQPHPTIPGRPERHATELAGVITGSEGRGGLQGVAPGASILPIRAAGWQPDTEGGYTVYSRTDQLLAGLEAAVDPNEDGDTLDAARVALIGFVEPYASFPEGPLAQAIAGATALDTLVVVPAGNDGRAGPSFGSIAGPGGAPSALTVAAADTRLAAPTVRVLVRAGLRVLFEDQLPLGGDPQKTVTADAVTVTRRQARSGHCRPLRRGGVEPRCRPNRAPAPRRAVGGDDQGGHDGGSGLDPRRRPPARGRVQPRRAGRSARRGARRPDREGDPRDARRGHSRDRRHRRGGRGRERRRRRGRGILVPRARVRRRPQARPRRRRRGRSDVRAGAGGGRRGALRDGERDERRSRGRRGRRGGSRGGPAALERGRADGTAHRVGPAPRLRRARLRSGAARPSRGGAAGDLHEPGVALVRRPGSELAPARADAAHPERLHARAGRLDPAGDGVRAEGRRRHRRARAARAPARAERGPRSSRPTRATCPRGPAPRPASSSSRSAARPRCTSPGPCRCRCPTRTC